MTKVYIEVTKVPGLFIRYEARLGVKLGLGFTKAGAIRSLKHELRSPVTEVIEIDIPSEDNGS